MSRAALMINLGSPKSYDVPDVKKYLDEFLMDEHVIDLPYFWRSLIVRGIILNVRPKKSAEAYKSIWWDDGSPLIVLSEKLAKKVNDKSSDPVYLAMRYAEPSIAGTLQKIKQEQPDLDALYVIPLYPHFAMSSYETVVDKVIETAAEELPGVNIKFKKPWYDDENYVSLLADSIKDALPDDHHLLLSYHGVPLRHLKKSDPTGVHCCKVEHCCQVDSEAHRTCYRHQTQKTSQLLQEKLGLDDNRLTVSYQSRLGPDQWMQPFTKDIFAGHPDKGIRKIAVACPAFVSDCLETLEEINVEGRETFMEAGGENFEFIPCLNDRKEWADLLARWIDTDED
ncbi:MAG: ferrochelatase [Saprospiraceae bacterium]|nr:ferrochelatase [Saprospiraceae bacterium]